MASKEYAMVPAQAVPIQGVPTQGVVLGAIAPAMMTITVAAPPGAAPGQLMQIQVPGTGQLLQVQIPAGCPEQGQFQVQVPAAPGVVTTQPMAAGPTPAEVQAKVHDIVRKGGTLHSSDAMAYSKSLTPEQADIKNAEGCHYCVPVTCMGCPGCVCTYNVACNDTCLWFPCCLLGLCFPVYSWVCCSCERSENAWITRDKHGRKTGAIILVDYEKGTLAHYGVECCKQDLEASPQCYCKRA